MILVLPFCARDGALAVRNLLWIEELDGKLPFECVLSHDTETPATVVRDMTIVATRIFSKVDVFWYPAPEKKYWPAAPNWAFQNVARYIEAVVKKDWLFMEADAVPIRKGWLQEIAREHAAGGRPFTGHIVGGMGHPNGVCVYPPNVAAYSLGAMRTEETAWDVVLGADLRAREDGILAHVHSPLHLFDHCWAVNKETGKRWNGAGEVASFNSMNDVLRLVDLSAVLFHRCKDGSLIDWLRIYHRDPSAAMVPQHANEDDKNRSENRRDSEHSKGTEPMDGVVSGGAQGGGSSQVDAGVDRRDEENSGRAEATAAAAKGGSESETTGEAAGEKGVVLKEPALFDGKCEIFIVTYGLPTKRVSGQVVSDFDWLAWCLRCIRRHATGFTGITLAIPDRDAKLLAPIANEHAQAKGGKSLRIKMFKEPPGKGFLMHEVVMASADEFVPKDTTHVLHLDADCMFKEPVTPSDYIEGKKPVYLWRTYDSLIEIKDGQKVVSDCLQWKTPTENQLGFSINEYTMLRHPTVLPIGFYQKYRYHVAASHPKPFPDYMLSGKNDFPQDRMDWTAMGAFAFHKMHDSFEWIDCSGGNHLAPMDKLKAYWSHAAPSDHIKAEIESFLK